MSMKTLRCIAIGGGAIALGGAFYFSRRIQDNFRQTAYYKQSQALLEQYKPGVDILGKPIRYGNLDLGDTEKTWALPLQAQRWGWQMLICVSKMNTMQLERPCLIQIQSHNKLAIPVRGMKNRGMLYSFASRQNTETSWAVDKLDLEVTSVLPRWTFYIRPGSGMKPTCTSESNMGAAENSHNVIENLEVGTGANREPSKTNSELLYVNLTNR